MKISSRVIEDAIKAKTDNLPSDPADDSDVDSQLATIDGFHDVPSADSAANSQIRDVVGNKTDGSSGNSLYSLSHIVNDHIHSASKVYPTLAAGVTVTGAAGAWTLGDAAAIVPASTIGSPFDIHHVSIEAISANDVYELVLYYGAGSTECGRVRFTKNANLDATMNIPIQTPIIPADSKIDAKVANSAGGAETVDISVFYHIY